MTEISRERKLCKILRVAILVFAVLVSATIVFFCLNTSQRASSASMEMDTVKSIISEGYTFKGRTRTSCNQTLQEELNERDISSEDVEVSTSRTMGQLSDTIIVDCPLNSDQIDAGDMRDTIGQIKTGLIGRNYNRSSIKIWFKYTDVGQDEMNITLCNELVTTGHGHHWQNFVGILGNHSGVMDPAIQDKRNGVHQQDFLERQQVWGEEYLKFVNEFRSKGLKYGFMLEPDSCFRFPSLVAKDVILGVDNIFFAQKAHVYVAFRDNFPMCVDWDIYDECKDYLKVRVPGVGSLKRVLEVDYMSFEEFIGILKNEI